MDELNFLIQSGGPISIAFQKQGFSDFRSAANFVHTLPYKRNQDKTDLTCVLRDRFGTCSTKHALLKVLADENNFEGLDLVLSIFKMNGQNTTQVSKILSKYNLMYIPEAHNYLKYKNQIVDLTKKNFSASNFKTDILEETVIEPGQITDYKVAIHKKYLIDWLSRNKNLSYNPEELWLIREECIAALSES